MTLLTFSILDRNNYSFTISLIKGKANLKVKSLKNKTLLMYAIESYKNPYHFDIMPSLFIKEVNDHEWINARDSDGYTAAHYRLNKKKLKNDPYFGDDEHHIHVMDNLCSAGLIEDLLDAGADRLASIIQKHWKNCFAYHENISKSTALHSILQFKNPQTQYSIDMKRISIYLILKDLIYRRTFGLFVPEGEKILMEKLIAEDIDFRKLAHTYEQNIIQGELKTKVLKYDDKSITYFDFIMSCFDDRRSGLIVKNKSLIDAFENTFPNPEFSTLFESHRNNREYINIFSVEAFITADYLFFRKQISKRIEKTSRRLEQLEELKKVENLRKAIPLSYELVLIIVEYCNYQELKNFIQAFYL
ncbi:Protein of unknown function [Cotesia congregata]|uniref:Ankyrin repeat protein n=1 Tax=Cotesia congregata TaxID=51543 RepID=A0A8J2HBK2_COTCN|nr:Protein of unknown function [Cotesia congregata]